MRAALLNLSLLRAGCARHSIACLDSPARGDCPPIGRNVILSKCRRILAERSQIHQCFQGPRDATRQAPAPLHGIRGHAAGGQWTASIANCETNPIWSGNSGRPAGRLIYLSSAGRRESRWLRGFSRASNSSDDNTRCGWIKSNKVWASRTARNASVASRRARRSTQTRSIGQ
jgi:hypothetical protein